MRSGDEERGLPIFTPNIQADPCPHGDEMLSGSDFAEGVEYVGFTTRHVCMYLFDFTPRFSLC